MESQTNHEKMGPTSPIQLDQDDAGLPNPGILSYATPETVCGKDTRTRVSPAKSFPYYWACSLRMSFEGDLFIGSGWLASTGSPKYDVVVTSGHCVWGGGKFADWVEVVPGRDQTEAPWGKFKVKAEGLRASEKWRAQTPDKSDHDYGAILIPKTGTLGAIGYAVMSDQELTGRVVTNTGYPGDKPSGTLWTGGGPIKSVTPRKIQYMIDTFGGQSGSYTYTWSDDNVIRVVGIHGYGGCPNAAVRITNDVVNDLVAWGSS